MTDQLAIDFSAPPLSAAIVMGAAGMARAADHAERQAPGFADRAFDFLIAWIGWRSIGEAFSAETVVEEAKLHGISPPDGRAWGGVFLRAASRGAIRRSSVLFRRAKGHGVEARGWERVR